jgi:hypothetical protein
MKRLSASAALAAGLSLAVPAAAQDAAQPAPEPACELHIWPAAEIKGYGGGAISPMVYGGGLIGVLIASKTSERDDHSAPKAKVLGADHQLDLLEAASLPWLLQGRKMTVVRHAEPLPRLEITAVKERHAPSPSPCYAELIVSQLYVDRAPMAGTEFRSLFVYRNFEDAPQVKTSFSTWTASSIEPVTSGSIKTFEGELTSAFVYNVKNFAAYAKAPKPAPAKGAKKGRK